MCSVSRMPFSSESSASVDMRCAGSTDGAGMLSDVGIGGTVCASVGADGRITGCDERAGAGTAALAPGSVPAGSVFARGGFGCSSVAPARSCFAGGATLGGFVRRGALADLAIGVENGTAPSGFGRPSGTALGAFVRVGGEASGGDALGGLGRVGIDGAGWGRANASG